MLNFFKEKKKIEKIGNYFEKITFSQFPFGVHFVYYRRTVKMTEDNWEDMCKEAKKFMILIHPADIIKFIKH